ncbi:hypothetical protein MJH12_07280, partial [bacterium]|nr:hypothetical protein [bacterium]
MFSFLRLVSTIFLVFLFSSFHFTAQECLGGGDPNSFFSYSGILSDQNGEIVSGFQTVEMRFELYSAIEGGSQSYSQTMTSIEVIDGMFKIEIGPCLPSLIEFMFVQIFVNSEELTPRTKLISNAISIESYNSQRFSGLSTGDLFTQVDQSIVSHLQSHTTNDVSPLVDSAILNIDTHKALVNNPHNVTKGQLALDQVKNINILSTFTQDPSQFIATSKIEANSANGLLLQNQSGQGLIITSSGNVGINTTAPMFSLEVDGTLNIKGDILQNGSPFSGASVFTDNTTNAIYDQGNLGIGLGINNPQNQLVVSGGLQLLNTTTVADINGTLRWTGSDIEVRKSDSWVSLSTSNSPTASDLKDADMDTFIDVENTADSDTIILQTNGTQRMVINSGGFIGMGTVTPSVELDVVVDTNISGKLIANSLSAISTTGDAGLKIGALATSNASILNFTAAGSHQGRMTYTHNATGANGSIDFRIGGVATSDVKLKVQGDGKVGIGTNSPSDLLDVAGTVRARVIRVIPTSGDASLLVEAGSTSNASIINFNAASSQLGRITYTHNATPANGSIDFRVGGVATGDVKLKVQGDGKVGIGTNSPSVELDVVGDANVSGKLIATSLSAISTTGDAGLKIGALA